MKNIKIKFNGTIVNLEAKEINGKEMYCLNQLWHVSGGKPSKRPTNWRNKESEAYYQSSKMSAVNINGSVKKTFGTEQVAYAYAAWIDAGFRQVVMECFTEAVNGNGQKAVEVAQSVVTLAARDSLRTNHKELTNTITTAYEDGQLKAPCENLAHSNVQRLAVKIVSGKTPSQIKSMTGLSPREYFLSTDDWKSLMDLERTLAKIETMIELGFDYPAIKAKLCK